mgnify:CR=1 FL=1|jgi:hypothetical protein
MLDRLLLYSFAAPLRRTVAAARLHRAALLAIGRGRYAAARELFDAAVPGYRRELRVESLARLRIHEMMGRVLERTEPERDGERCNEIVRRLAALDQIESPAPPHAKLPVDRVLAEWRAALMLARIEVARPDRPGLATPDAIEVTRAVRVAGA